MNDAKLLKFIADRGEVTLKEIRNFIRQEKLWFGPGTSYADVLWAYEANGKLSIDLEKGLVKIK